MSETFFSRLKNARLRANIRANKLASDIGISTGYLSQLENGKRSDPSADLVSRLAASLGVSVDWLISGKSGTVVNHDEIRKERDDAYGSPDMLRRENSDLRRMLAQANDTIAIQARTIEAMQGRAVAAPVSGACGGGVYSEPVKRERKAEA